jgi:tetratricopeptide (TPR) repeat protein
LGGYSDSSEEEKNMKAVISFWGPVGLLCLVLCPTVYAQSLQENLKAGRDALDQKRFADAEKSLTAALKQAEVEKPENTTQRILYFLAGAYRGQQKYAEAEQCFARALSIMEKTPEKDVRLTMGSYNGLGGMLLSQRKYAQAEHIFKQSVEFGEDTANQSRSKCTLPLMA